MALAASGSAASAPASAAPIEIKTGAGMGILVSAYGSVWTTDLVLNRLVGRIEPVFDRREKVLRVRGLWWEKGTKPVDLEEPLASLAAFLGADLAV